MKPKTHRHRSVREEDWGWIGCVAPGAPGHADRAHGCVVIVRSCSCGATQMVEANGGWRNYGTWVLPEEAGEAR